MNIAKTTLSSKLLCGEKSHFGAWRGGGVYMDVCVCVCDYIYIYVCM